MGKGGQRQLNRKQRKERRQKRKRKGVQNFRNRRKSRAKGKGGQGCQGENKPAREKGCACRQQQRGKRFSLFKEFFGREGGGNAHKVSKSSRELDSGIKGEEKSWDAKGPQGSGRPQKEGHEIGKSGETSDACKNFEGEKGGGKKGQKKTCLLRLER